MTEIILNARWLIAGIDDVGSVELYENAGLVFKNNMILDLGHFGDIRSKYPLSLRTSAILLGPEDRV